MTLQFGDKESLRWMKKAGCSSVSVHLFFPEGTKKHLTLDARKRAKEFCSLCPVQEECLEYALENDIKDGMWGGLTPAERKRLARKRKYG